MPSPFTLAQLNSASPAEFVQLLQGIYEHSPWIAKQAAEKRPFVTWVQLQQALVDVVRSAPVTDQLALLRAHPELAGKAMVAQALTAESTHEQQQAGLQACSPAEFERLQALNAAYNTKFGFPFILAVRGPDGRGLTRTEIIQTLARRLQNHPDFEFAECLRQVHRIAALRLRDKWAQHPLAGQQVLAWSAALAQHSEQEQALTVTYLTPAHRACAQQIAAWMQGCGFDHVHTDAVGNVVGIYEGSQAGQRRLLTGSHYDTVRDGGRYDGRLGIWVPMLAVRSLAQAQQRLPFGIEVVAFAEEEGQRYAATFLGSSALVGDFDLQWLAQPDAQGVTMGQAMRAVGLPGDLASIAALKRQAADYLGFVEVHIEQGPVLSELDLPLGVVTSINGCVRYRCEIVGQAGHAGTTPMGMRRDALAAGAELALFLEQRAAQAPALVGTIGMMEVPNGAVNVIPGRCRFTVDIRATTDAVRDACATDTLAALAQICQRRGLAHEYQEVLRVSAAPSALAWQQRWEQAVQALGLTVHRLPSGAGHDAMKLHQILPQAMLFVRGLHAGISHNPLEAITDDDAELAVQAFQQLLQALAQEFTT